MDCKIKQITKDDIYLDEVLNLVKIVFDEFEAPDYEEKGIKTFYKFIEKDNINRMLDENLDMYAMFDGKKVIGTIAYRDKSHISLLFMDKNYHRMGLASELLFYTRKKCASLVYTVNSSPYAVGFYKKRGFVKTEEEQTKDGIRFTPMRQEIELL
jgi:ribosomal protein S18 acetylase RimI-like enzyme